jgi:hypothetical protein
MGFSAAANAQNQGTQQAMMMQALQAQQAQQAIQQGQQQAAGALQAGQTGALGAIGQGIQAYDPYQQLGTQSANALANAMGISGNTGAAGYGSLMNMPTIAQLQMDPSYAWRLQQGQGALQNSIRAGIGGANAGSGAAMKAITDYGQNAASQEYGNAYARFMQNRANQIGLLQGGVGTGLNAAQGIGGLQTNAANIYTGTGANLANTYTGTGQQLAGNYNQLGQNLGQGYANMGAANASAYMGPTNLMAALAGQALGAGATYLGMKARG